MKEKIKRFFLEKKELLVFLGVLAVIFGTVITVVTLALKDSQASGGDPDNSTGSNSAVLPSSNATPSKSITESDPDANATGSKEIVTIALPVNGDYKIVREYFDTSRNPEELAATAIIVTGSSYVESKGISYAKSDNKTFEVNAIYPGTIKSKVYDEANGFTVTIEHEDGLVSVYKSLAECSYNEGDTVKQTSVIGKAGSRVFDTAAGVHVHLEVTLNDTYLNPTSIFGKELSEVSAMK